MKLATLMICLGISAPSHATVDHLLIIKQPLRNLNGDIEVVDVPFIIAGPDIEATLHNITAAHIPQQNSYHEIGDINAASLCKVLMTGIEGNGPSYEVSLDLRQATDIKDDSGTVRWRVAAWITVDCLDQMYPAGRDFVLNLTVLTRDEDAEFGAKLAARINSRPRMFGEE